MVRIRVSEPSAIPLSVGKAKVVIRDVPSEPYVGSYEVMPTVKVQRLGTENKLMQQDVTVHAIPYYDVSNTAGGNTIYIGSEV